MFLKTTSNATSYKWGTTTPLTVIESDGLIQTSWGTSFAINKYTNYLLSPGKGILTQNSNDKLMSSISITNLLKQTVANQPLRSSTEIASTTFYVLDRANKWFYDNDKDRNGNTLASCSICCTKLPLYHNTDTGASITSIHECYQAVLINSKCSSRFQFSIVTTSNDQSYCYCIPQTQSQGFCIVEDVGVGSYTENNRGMFYDKSNLYVILDYTTPSVRGLLPINDQGGSGCQPNGNENNAESNKCGMCMGDCDQDEDCTQGLVCYQRSSKQQVVPGCTTDISKYVKTTADHDYCYSAVFENNQNENSGSNIGWKKYGVPKIKGVRRYRNEGSQNGKEEDVNYNFIWSAIGDSNVIGGSGGMEGVEEEVNGKVNGGRTTCQWKPMNRLENGAGLIATTTCSDVLRDLFDDICFMGMLTTLSTRQRNWICRMMSEEGCQFIKGECSVLKDL